MSANDLAVRDPSTFLTMVITLRRLRSVPPDLFYEYWRDAHVQIACRLPGIHSLWINFLDYDGGAQWPRVEGIEHELAEEDRFDGVPEPTFLTEADLARFGAAMAPLMDDEINIFEEQIGYSAVGDNSRTIVDRLPDPAPNGDEEVLRLWVWLQQADGVSDEEFREFVGERFAPTLASADEVLKLRLHLLEPYVNDEVFLTGQGVSHHKAPEKQYQACFEIVFDDALGLRTFSESEAWLGTVASQQRFLRAQHAFQVTRRYCMRYNGRITLAGLRTAAVADQIRRVGAQNQVRADVISLLGGDPLGDLAAEIAPSFAGELIGPDAPEYEDARTIWNGMVDQRPGLIARCTSREDVVSVVRAAKKRGVVVSVLGGGHGVAGKALCDGGVTIDLGGMRNVVVDPERKLVHVDGGCKLGDVDEATAPHALAVPAGIVSDTGVGGLALGGGIGWLSRKHGLTCDNFAALELVTADGEVLEVTEETHPDLLWALRGGGGNFGVVTRFTFHAHELGPNIRMGIAVYNPEDAKEALLEYARVYPSLPNSVGWHGALKRVMPDRPFVPRELVGKPALMLFAMWLSDVADPEGVEWIERLSRTGSPVSSDVVEIPFAMRVQRMLDEEFPGGRRYYTKEGHLEEFSEDAIDTLVDFFAGTLSSDALEMDGEVEIIGLGGAIKDVPEDAAAFANRRSDWWINYAIHWGDATLDAAYVEHVRASYERLRPWVGKGVYVNMLNFDELDRVVEAYGGPAKYERLGEVKARYDPDNFFRRNHNIAPAARAEVAR